MNAQARRLSPVMVCVLLVVAFCVTATLALAGVSSASQEWRVTEMRAASTPPVIGRHCGGIGLIAPDQMCGCIWGHVRFQDDPPDAALAGVEVRLHFANDIISDITAPGLGEPPYYALTAERLGARRGNSVTLSAQYGEYLVTKHVVLDPDPNTGEQQEDLVFPAPRPAELPTPTPTPAPIPGVSALGWSRDGYDLTTSNYYPYPSQPLADPNAPFTRVWAYKPQSPGRSFFAYTADVNADGWLEVVVAAYDTVTVLDSNGVVLWSRTFPVHVSPYGNGEVILALLDDFSGDGVPDIVVTYKTGETMGNVAVYNGFGEQVASFTRPAGVSTDGDLAAYAIWDGEDGHKKLYTEIHSNWDITWRGGILFDAGDGSQDWVYRAGRNLRPSIGDINGDGKPEFVSRQWVAVRNGANGCGYGFNTCTNDWDLWTVVLELDGDEIWSRRLHDSQTIGALFNKIVDLDRNGAKEILALESHWAGTGISQVHLLNPQNGEIMRSFVGPNGIQWRDAAVADLDGDGKDEVILGSDNGVIRILDSNLALVRQASVFERDVRAVNDINGDGRKEIIVTSHDGQPYWVAVLRDDLSVLWRTEFNDAKGMTFAIVSDLNRDGVNDLLVSMNPALYVFSQKPWGVPPPPPPPTPPPDAKSLILVNAERLAHFNPDQAGLVPDVMTALAQLAAHPDVNGTVVYLEDDPTIRNAYLDWDSHWPDCPGVTAQTTTTYANQVADRIKELIHARVQAQPEIRYVVLVGDDRVIPYRRVEDRSPAGFHENLYSWIAVTTTVGSAMADERILTDDFYGDVIAETDPRIAHIPDLAVGRLVESPSQILAMINAFLSQSSIVQSLALVVGTSLLKDLAHDQQSLLAGDGVAVSYLNNDAWNEDDLETRLLQTRQSLNAVNTHATHWLYGSPAGGNLTAQAVTASNVLNGTVVFGPGCQAGLNIGGANGTFAALDFPEAFAGRGASYVGNTGWGIGDWGFVAFSERLYLDLVAQLTAGTATRLGDALVAAKRAYYQTEGTVDGYDEKVLLQTTLYGLPQYGVRQQGSASSAATGKPASRGYGLIGIQRQQETLTAVRMSAFYEPASSDFQAMDGDRGRYYTVYQRAQLDDGSAVQPLQLTELTEPSGEAHGILFRGGWYQDQPAFDPVVIAASLITGTMPPEPPVKSTGWSPPVLSAINTIEECDAQQQRLAIQFGQYHGSRAVERLYSRVVVDVFYSDSPDYDPPTLLTLDSNQIGNLVDITATANDSSGVKAVVVAFTAGDGQWQTIDLVESAVTGVWRGNIPSRPGLEYFIQVMDGAGNVLTEHNSGWYFTNEPPPPVSPQVKIENTPEGVLLTWTHSPANVRYEVWRHTVPYFDPIDPNCGATKLQTIYPFGSPTVVTFTDRDATNHPEESFYYVVRAVNGGGVPMESNRTGRSVYPLVTD